jgi:hypothetical protein
VRRKRGARRDLLNVNTISRPSITLRNREFILLLKISSSSKTSHTQEDRMLSKEESVFKPKFSVIIGVILGLVISSQFLHMPAAHAQSSRISKDSVDLLTRTGRAMAEVTAAVKPAIVNISTSRTKKVSGGTDPFDDPFQKVFRRQFQTPETAEERNLSASVQE